MRRALIALILVVYARAHADPVRCDEAATSELAIDGLADDWSSRVVARAGAAGGTLAVRCAWDGAALALYVDVGDDRVVRSARHNDTLELGLRAGAAPATISVSPATATARARAVVPRGATVADSLQRAGFAVEARIPAAAIPSFSPSTPSLTLSITFHDADQAARSADHDVPLALTLELGDRSDLLAEFLAAVRLTRGDVKLDRLADLDPDRQGPERVVAGGTVIGVLTDRFAYVAIPVVRASDIQRVALLPLGARGLQVISAVVTQRGNGGTRDLLLLWTVWSGQLQPLAQIELAKQQAGNALTSTFAIHPGKRAPELWVEAQPAVGWTADTFHETPADDADPIPLPWDPRKRGTAYTLVGAELTRRELPKH